MTEQLALIAAPPRLTTRQQSALDQIAARQPLSSEDLGAWIHERRLEDGGRGHSAANVCTWCAQEGKAIGAVLRAKNLVKYSRKCGGWILTDYTPTDTGNRGDASFGTFPDNF